MAITRRRFISTFSKGAASIAIVGIAACSDGESSPTTTAVAGTTQTPAASSTTAGSPATTLEAPTTTAGATTSEAPPSTAAGEWRQIALGSVSAYVVARNGEAALVDTGNPGSADSIEQALAGLGLGWSNLGHVILTHSHPDHVGSIAAVMDAAPDAAGYIGEGDAGAVTAPRALTTLTGGERIFDLDVLSTPGHTPGSISVFDPAGMVLVAGDALQGGSEPGSIIGANPRFSSDLEMADASVVTLASLQPATIMPGHGAPVTQDAAQKLAALAASL